MEAVGVLATGNTKSEARIDWKEIETSRGKGGFVSVLGDEMGSGAGVGLSLIHISEPTRPKR